MRSKSSVPASVRKYYRDRLADPSLLKQAVLLDLGKGIVDLAVPVGGSRQSGSVCVTGIREGRRVMQQLAEHPTLFPNPWFIPGGRQYMANVCWGEPYPPMPSLYVSDTEWAEHERVLGRLHGYSEEVIEQFVARHFGAHA